MYALIGIRTVIHMEGGEEVNRETTETELCKCDAEALLGYLQTGILPEDVRTA